MPFAHYIQNQHRNVVFHLWICMIRRHVCLTQLLCVPPQPSAPPLFTSPCKTGGCWRRCSFPVRPAGGALWKVAVRCPGSSIPGQQSRCTMHAITPTSRSCKPSSAVHLHILKTVLSVFVALNTVHASENARKFSLCNKESGVVYS